MNGAFLKLHARKLMQESKPSIIKVGLIFVAISLLFNLLSSYLVGVQLTDKDILQISEHIENGNMDFAIAYLSDYMPGPGARLVDLLLELVMTIVSMGFVIFLLNTIRSNAPCYGNLLDGFGMPWRIIFLSFLKGLFVILWSLLLFIPGIIAAYSYRMADYLLIDHPEYSVMQCLKESKRMMKGHKWELFGLDLSFIGWAFLASLPVIGWAAAPWTVPYLSTTYALYYEQLSGHNTTYNNYTGSDGYNNYNGYSDQNWH